MAANIQYLRTDRAIQTALLSLLGKHPYEKITVQDILDETPVSRATFYKHFRDKDEILEKIQSEILHTHTELCRDLAQAAPDQYPALVERFSLRCREISQILMKVRTGRIDLPRALAAEARRSYLENSTGPTGELEARIYAGAATAMMAALLEDDAAPADRLFDATLAVALHLVGLPGDEDLRQLILQKRQK